MSAVDVGAAVADSLALLHEPGSVFEIRIPNSGRAGTVSGYFDNVEAAAKAIARYDHKVPGIYVTLNPVNAALLARSANRLKERARETTADADVARRSTLLIDVDYKRPAGISASDDEVAAAGEVARAIRVHLTSAGWPGPVLAMSGNGWHLLYRIDLANDEASRDLVKRLLERLAERFDSDGAEVDTSVFNAARIAKVPGTWVCKGDDLADRPHRQSEIVDRPGELQVVDLALLQAAAGPAQRPQAARANYRGNGHGEFDVEAFLVRNHLVVRKHKADTGGDLWELEECPFNAEHAHGEAFVRRDAGGSLSAGCQHAHCFKTWHELRERFEPGYDDRRTETATSQPTAKTPAAAEVRGARSTWPAPLSAAAYHGPIGALVKAWAPQSEADPAAMLITTLVGFGAICGCGPHHSVSGDRHAARLFACVTGPSSSGRKGHSYGAPLAALTKVDPVWAERCLASGLSTGEGLIHRVRDKVWGLDKGENPIVTDAGIADKRLFIKEAEFARVLIVMARKDNTLSPVIRDFYDTGTAGVITKGSHERATDAHVCIIAHVTAEELHRALTDVDAANGFANRFLWVCSHRHGRLPFGGQVDDRELEPHIYALQEATGAILAGEFNGEVPWSKDTMPLWDAAYDGLMAGGAGLCDAIIARGQPQVLRLALVYALADGCHEIRPAHLTAALEVWRYCVDSARCIFGDKTGDRTADRIRDALKTGDLNRTEISELFDRHKTKAEIDAALEVLAAAGFAHCVKVNEGNRHVEVWRASDAPSGDGDEG